MTDPVDFVRAHTILTAAPLAPELRLHLADAITPIWQASEMWLGQKNIDPPFWAFAWPGGQALARHVLDHSELVAGRRVLDFAAGCGIAALACARAGADVLAADIDPMAVAAVLLNAAANGLLVETTAADLVGSACAWDMILCGDVCYEAPMTRHILPWLRSMAATADVWVADPGRSYLPRNGISAFAEYLVPTTLELEDQTERRVVLYRVAAI